MTDTIKATIDKDEAILAGLTSHDPAARCHARMIAALHDSYQAWLFSEGQELRTNPQAIVMAIHHFAATGIATVLVEVTEPTGDAANIEVQVDLFRRILTVGVMATRQLMPANDD